VDGATIHCVDKFTLESRLEGVREEALAARRPTDENERLTKLHAVGGGSLQVTENATDSSLTAANMVEGLPGGDPHGLQETEITLSFDRLLLDVDHSTALDGAHDERRSRVRDFRGFLELAEEFRERQTACLNRLERQVSLEPL
jgi:hypothetical protein